MYKQTIDIMSGNYNTLAQLCKHGHIEEIHKLLNQEEYTYHLYKIEYFIKTKEHTDGEYFWQTDTQRNLDDALKVACERNDETLIDLIIKFGASWYTSFKYFAKIGELNSVKSVLEGTKRSPKHGYKEILIYSLKKCCKLERTSKYSLDDIIDYIIYEFKSVCDNYDRLLNESAKYGNINICNKLIKLIDKPNWKEVFKYACEGGNIEFVKIIKNTFDGKLDWKSGFYDSCIKGHLNVVKYLVKQYIHYDLISGSCEERSIISVGLNLAQGKRCSDLRIFLQNIISNLI